MGIMNKDAVLENELYALVGNYCAESQAATAVTLRKRFFLMDKWPNCIQMSLLEYKEALCS